MENDLLIVDRKFYKYLLHDPATGINRIERQAQLSQYNTVRFDYINYQKHKTNQERQKI
jgi:hypothetical protein